MLFGAVARRDHFCTLAALERHWYAGDSHGLRTWVLAVAVAIIVTQALSLGGLIDVSKSFYLTINFGWAGAILGGLAFGFGMALVGTCSFGALVRLGGGSLRSLIVLIVLGLSALAAQRGLVALARVHVFDNLSLDLGFARDQSIGSLISAGLGVDARAATATIVATVLLWWVFGDNRFRKRRRSIFTATIIGLCVASGWVMTSAASHHMFAAVQVESASFVAPVGDLILQFVAFTGVLPDYGVGLVIGVVLGAAIVAWRRRDIRWEACDDARELGRHLMGGFLMGTGGIFALGCSVGQGISAASLLSVSAPIVMTSIVIGARLGLAYLLEGSVWRAFQFGQRHPAG